MLQQAQRERVMQKDGRMLYLMEAKDNNQNHWPVSADWRRGNVFASNNKNWRACSAH